MEHYYKSVQQKTLNALIFSKYVEGCRHGSINSKLHVNVVY